MVALDFLIDLVADVVFGELLVFFMILNDVFFVVVGVVLMEELVLVLLVVEREVVVLGGVLFLGLGGLQAHEFFKIFLKTVMADL